MKHAFANIALTDNVVRFATALFDLHLQLEIEIEPRARHVGQREVQLAGEHAQPVEAVAAAEPQLELR